MDGIFADYRESTAERSRRRGQGSDPAAEPGDNLNLTPPQQTIDVTKDIALATVNGGFVTISEIRQSFTQVPEAATTALVCIGLALIGATAHRKARNS